MKSIFLKIFSILFIFISISACENFLGGDFNDNPNGVVSVSLPALFPTTIVSLSQLHYNISFSTSQVTQQMYGGGPSDHEAFTLAGSWSEAYLLAMNNLDQVIEQAQREGLPHYEGMAQVLMAFNIGMITDTWEDVPYSEAFKGSLLLKPKYDTQESLYAEIDNLLNAALINLATPNVEGLEPSSDDLVYDGDMSQWMMLANGLKARYALHLSNKNTSTAASSALSALANSFGSNADDFELTYDETVRNLWHVTPVLANNTGNITIRPGAYFIDNLNGVNFPFTTITEDPRLFAITDINAGDAGPFTGATLDTNDPGSVDLNESSYYTTESAPLTMISYAELKFIEAEAQMIAGNTAGAYTAYLEGISANMDKVGVSTADRDAYLADASVAVGSGALTMALIMKEKYIALFLNPETWVDMRRLDYATSVYPNLATPPVGIQGEEIAPGAFPQRALYPVDEYNRNNDNVTSATKPFGAKMWRDQ